MRDEIEAKGIEYVFHFTRLDNLVGIFAHGLIGRLHIENLGVSSWFNDEYRFDGQPDAICCSLGHPNYKMFYRLRRETPNAEWVVIVLRASILWEKDCAFCATNAASNSVVGIPIAQRRGAAAFNRLFDEVPGKPLRSVLNIPNFCPTDPQAEVLVFGNIETGYIMGAVTQSQRTADTLKRQFPNYEFIYHRSLFLPRKDYEHWR